MWFSMKSKKNVVQQTEKVALQYRLVNNLRKGYMADIYIESTIQVI